MRRYVLGIDAGNSKTIAIVADADGHIVGWGRTGCGDIYGAGEADALDAISTASHTALTAADVRADALSAVVLSAAGADWPEDFEFLRASIRARGLGEPIVYNDAIGGLRAGSPDGTGVAVVCGTGTAIGSRAKDGRLWHSSFWQGPQGGNFLSSVAFDAVVRAELGVAPPTALTPAVLSYFGVDTVEAALHRCTARGKPHPPVTPLAKVLLDVADEGDAVARRIVIEHGHALGDYALVAARKVGIEREPFYLVLSGGVMRHPSSLLPNAVIERVCQFAPDVRPVRSEFEPAIGAAMLALEAIGITIEAAVKQRLRATMLPHTLFDT